MLYKFITIIILSSISIIISSCDKKDQNEIEQIISKSDRLWRLNSLCSSITLPNDVIFRYKKITSKESLAIVIFFYDFGKNIKEKSLKLETLLIKQGWEFDDFRYHYVKGSQYIALESGYWNLDSNYSITCGEGIS